MVDGGREGQRGEMANAGIVRASAPAWASGWQSAVAAALISWAVGSLGNDAGHLFLAGLELLDFAPTTAQAKMKPTGPLTQSSVPIVPTFPRCRKAFKSLVFDDVCLGHCVAVPIGGVSQEGGALLCRRNAVRVTAQKTRRPSPPRLTAQTPRLSEGETD
jgi:hypothetical protein